MKFILNLLLGIALPVFAASNLSSSMPINKQGNVDRESRPYIIEEMSARGEKISETKGISAEGDPFLISKAIGANPYEEDRFSSFPSLNMGIGGKITLYRAPDYKIKDGKKEFVIRSWTKTVGDLLSENKIELGQDDKINFSPSTPLELNMNINIIRVAKTIVVESKPIDYKTIKKEDPNLEKGLTKVDQKGKFGKRNLYYEVTREDGEEKTRVLKKTEVDTPPVDEKLTIGTKIVSYGTGEASWYVSSNQMIGACNILPRGTKVRVVNLANGKSVEITTSGGGIKTSGRIVDLSTAAFQALGATLGQGTIGNVRLEKVY